MVTANRIFALAFSALSLLMATAWVYTFANPNFWWDGTSNAALLYVPLIYLCFPLWWALGGWVVICTVFNYSRPHTILLVACLITGWFGAVANFAGFVVFISPSC